MVNWLEGYNDGGVVPRHWGGFDSPRVSFGQIDERQDMSVGRRAGRGRQQLHRTAGDDLNVGLVLAGAGSMG